MLLHKELRSYVRVVHSQKEEPLVEIAISVVELTEREGTAAAAAS